MGRLGNRITILFYIILSLIIFFLSLLVLNFHISLGNLNKEIESLRNTNSQLAKKLISNKNEEDEKYTDLLRDVVRLQQSQIRRHNSISITEDDTNDKETSIVDILDFNKFQIHDNDKEIKKKFLKDLSNLFEDEHHPTKYIMVSYGDKCCKESLPKNVKSALKHGFHEAYGLSSKDLPKSFRVKNDHILRHARGAGYWLWKPKIILDTMRKYPLSKNILIYYCDAGQYFKNNITDFLDRLRNGKRDVNIFSQLFYNSEYTKRDAFILMDVDNEKYYGPPHAIASPVVFRNTLWARYFVSEWVRYAEDERILTDKPNVMGKENLERFKAHRHDESVLTNLVYKWNVGWDEVGTHNTFKRTRNKR